jgi:superfamily II DNA or RNA helicase
MPFAEGIPGFVEIDDALPRNGGWRLYVRLADGDIDRVDVSAEQVSSIEVLADDGAGDPARCLAGLWSIWMQAATSGAAATALATTPLRPYAHQQNAVYGTMLPQPNLRFLLADEPGTGKTVMAGLYLREMQRLALVRRGLVVAPANLVTKWQADFERFFGGGLRRITAATIRENALSLHHDLWIVSLELAAINPQVQEAIRPDRAGWDVVVFDEAHRLTPTAETFYRVGELLAKGTPRALLMTATPHRGREWLFRALLHLVDPDVFPEVSQDDELDRTLKPGPVHFLRRMKEDLVDYDGKTRLFKGRRASNKAVPLNLVEDSYYREALDLVGQFFPPVAQPLARMVYGKRAASSLYALAETLRRRRDLMGTELPTAAAAAANPDDDDPGAADEAKVIVEQSTSARAEKKALNDILQRLDPLLASPTFVASKWSPLVSDCLEGNGIHPGSGEQAVVFTEFADTADWLVKLICQHGYSAERYSGRDAHPVRDEIRARFAQRDFQILVSTDAGNEGIDLQTAHVLVNWDIPWSLVRLEQRMGRIHRVGQTREVELYNLVATGTREGDVMAVLLDNFVTAANQLDGRMFDSLSLVAEIVGVDVESELAATYAGDASRAAAALAAVKAVTNVELRRAEEQLHDTSAKLASKVDVAAAIAALHEENLERINPAIVEAFLRRLHAAQEIIVAPDAAGEGIFALSAAVHTLPQSFGGSTRVLVATSGDALRTAREGGSVLHGALSLGPAEPAFRDLVGASADALAGDVFRGATMVDETSATPYDLFGFIADTVEGGGRTTGRWACLIRVDSAGARQIRWEALANLSPATDVTGAAPHPSRAHAAEQAARTVSAEQVSRRAAAMQKWLAGASHELRKLPGTLTEHMADATTRHETRGRLRTIVEARIATLSDLSKLGHAGLERVGWCRVIPGGTPLSATENDSEQIGMAAVTEHLQSEGFAVSDVHTEGRGYDLHATRGADMRLVEVKGVWQSASSQGIRMTGHEILIATQQADSYWLYVVDRCSEGGRIFGGFDDPVRRFGGLIGEVTAFQVPGSALKTEREILATQVS